MASVATKPEPMFSEELHRSVNRVIPKLTKAIGVIKKPELLAILIALNLTACVPVKRQIYLQPSSEGSQQELFTYGREDYKLQTNDIVDVKITSLNPDVNELFNSSSLGAAQLAQVTAQSGGDIFYITGYSVSPDGNIDIPFVGNVEIGGLTLAMAHEAIDSRIKELFANYHLQVKLGGVRFSVLGEFRQPGKHVVMQNQVTIFEAIAIGGDLTVTANREEIQLIRQYPDGTRIHRLNLTDQSIVGSPYYFMQPNDVLYAEPLPQRSWGLGITGAETLSAIISTLSTSIALTLSILSLTR